MEINGQCDPAFAGVRDVLAEQLVTGAQVGVAVAVQIDGRPVVDLWGGHTDERRTRPWQRDTLVNVWSTGKGIVALCAHLLADRGLLDLDAPVAKYWPEFAAAGKDDLPVRYLLSHRAGLAGPRVRTTVEDLYDWDLMTARLAATEPWWEPGTRSGYHALSYGYLVGEVVRRISGRTVGEFLREELAGPLGADFHIGLDPREYPRVATLVPVSLENPNPAPAPLPRVALASLANPVVRAIHANTDPWRAAEIPAANGHGTARAIAALYGVYAQRGEAAGRRYLSAEQVERAGTGQGACVDLVAGPAVGGRETEIALGCWLSGPDGYFGPNPRAYGHDGAGGSCGMADPEAGLALGYVMNLMGWRVFDDPRKLALINTVYDAL